MLAIFKKEMRTYFTSMIGYIFLVFFTFITGIFYSLYCVLYLNGDFTVVLSSIILVFLLLIPTVTMRLLAEESKQKTDQLLLTSPVKVTSIVVAKYLSAISLLLISILIISLFPLFLMPFGKIPSAQIFGAFVAFFLVGACFISVGLFISSLTDNQIVAAVASFGVLLAMYIMDSIVQGLPTSRISSAIFAVALVLLLALFVYNNLKNVYISVAVLVIGATLIVCLYAIVPTIFDGLMVNIFSWFSIMRRFENFFLGIFDISSIVYYISFASIFVYLTVQVIEKRRWS